MVNDMNRIKYKAILDFFNAIARINNTKQAKDFFDIYKYQLAAVTRALKFNDSLETINEPEDDPHKLAIDLLDNDELGIDFISRFIPFDAKNEIKIGKLLIGIIYHLNLTKRDLFNSALQHVDRSQNFDQEIEHIILYLENKEQWPADGWPFVLTISAPMDFSDRKKPLPNIHSASFARTPVRQSMRKTIGSPYKKPSSESPITKTKFKEHTRKINLLEKDIARWKSNYLEMGQKYDEASDECKTYKAENQKLKSCLENAKLKLQDYHSMAEELNKVKSGKDELQKEVKVLTESNRSLNEELKDCYKELEASNSDANNKQYQIELLEKAKDTFAQQVVDLNDELIEAKNDRDIMQKKLFETENTLKRMLQDYEQVKMQNNEMSRMSLSVADQSNIKLADENQILRDQITEISRKFEDERDEWNQEREREVNILKAEIERLNTKLTDVIRESEKRKGEIETLKKLEGERNAEILKFKSQIAETIGQFQGLKDLADEWTIKYDAEHEKLMKLQEIKNNLLKKEKNLEETVNAQNKDITVFKRKELGLSVINVLDNNTAVRERTSIKPEVEPTMCYKRKPIYRTPQEFYFSVSN